MVNKQSNLYNSEKVVIEASESGFYKAYDIVKYN